MIHVVIQQQENLVYVKKLTLWQLAREALHLSEDHFSVGHRLCFIDCSLEKLKLLAYCHSLYHTIKNDKACIFTDGNIKSPRSIQHHSSCLARALRALVE